MYVPATVAFIVTVEVPEPTIVWTLKAPAIPGEVVVESVTVPENPLTLEMVMVDVPRL